MKERPILFSAPMVRAILAGTKSQTRRIVKPQPELNPNYSPSRLDRYTTHPAYWWPSHAARSMVSISDMASLGPYGAPGDRLWVRETWFPDPPIDGWPGDTSWQDDRRIDGVPEHYRKPRHCIFAASWTGPALRWRPGIHMPRWASRITLEVTGVRVERLQAITEADALAEGVERHDDDCVTYYGPLNRGHACAVVAFEQLWCKINGAESWDANPWVWVIEFKLIERSAVRGAA